MCGEDAVAHKQGFSYSNYHFCQKHYDEGKLDMYGINFIDKDGNKIETPFYCNGKQNEYNPYLDPKNFIYPKNK